jgi:CRISPR/Cas system-associated exonuclease Cas4 (RecB family)
MIYCFCGDRKEIVYIYDPKFVTAYPKEFEIKFDREIIVDILDQCLKIKDALEKQRPPKRPIWAEKKEATCKRCPFKKTCWNHDSGRDGRAVQTPNRG